MPILIIVGIALICVIVLVCPVSRIIRIMLIGIIIKLTLAVGITRYSVSLAHEYHLLLTIIKTTYTLLLSVSCWCTSRDSNPGPTD